MLVRRSGVERLDKGGLIVGAFTDVRYEQDSKQLDPGDTLVVFSDGVTEALNLSADEFGEARLLSCLEANRTLPAHSLVDCLVAAIAEFTQGTTASDDLTILVLRHFDSRTPAS